MAALDENNAEPRSDSGTLDQSFYDRVAFAVGERIKQCGQRVPVITGWQSLPNTLKSLAKR